MVDNKLVIDFWLVWKKENDVKDCSCCGDLIVNGSNNGYMASSISDKIDPLNIVICNSCFDLIGE